ncbi:MAG TPA: HEAT repeat domain-containing protein, partial [Gemmataceae bacterium]|nr:HEAT repeat domain-containing protein [Gemmataceae bacterium]
RGRNAAVVAAVVDLLSDKDIQNQAIETLQTIAPTDRSNAQMAAAALIPLFENKLISFRSKVSNALAAMGRDAVTPLTQALSNADPGIRLGAADTLSQIGKLAKKRDTIRELTRCARTDNIVQVRQACQSALYRIQAR